MTPDKKDPQENEVQQAIDSLLTDPDAPENSDTRRPPQTTDAEPDDKN